MATALPAEARGTKAEAALHRGIVAERLNDSLNGNPHIAFAYTMGSTAQGKENEYSDKDMGVVVRGDDDLNFMLKNAGRGYGSFGELVGYYRYTPYHHYVAYQGAIGPMPLDIYYLTEEMHNLMRSPTAVNVIDHIGTATSKENEQGNAIGQMLFQAHVSLEKAKMQEEKGDFMGVASTLASMRSQSLIHLLRIVEHYAIPHVKAVNLTEFTPEIRDLFVRTFAAPTQESSQDAIRATHALISELLADASGMYDIAKLKQALSEGNVQAFHDTHQEGVKKELRPISMNGSVISAFDALPGVGLATLDSNIQGEQQLMVMMRDDEGLNELVERGRSLIHDAYPASDVEQVTPVHFKVKGKNGEQLDVFLSSSSLYYTSRNRQTLTLVDNRTAPIQNKETVFDSAPEREELQGERELVVKGIVRTFRLLSKINKGEYVTFTYILDSIRNGQLIPLLRHAGIAIEEESIFPLTYAKPTKEGVQNAVLAAMVLFADAYIRIRYTYSMNDLDVYVQKAYDAVKDFVQNS